MVLQSRIVVFSQGSLSNFVGFLLVMTLDPCKLCGVNNASRSFHQNNTQARLEVWTSGRFVFSLGLSGTRRPDNTRSLSLTADVPPRVTENLIGGEVYRKTRLSRTLFKFLHDPSSFLVSEDFLSFIYTVIFLLRGYFFEMFMILQYLKTRVYNSLRP